MRTDGQMDIWIDIIYPVTPDGPPAAPAGLPGTQLLRGPSWPPRQKPRPASQFYQLVSQGPLRAPQMTKTACPLEAPACLPEAPVSLLRHKGTEAPAGSHPPLRTEPVHYPEASLASASTTNHNLHSTLFPCTLFSSSFIHPNVDYF